MGSAPLFASTARLYHTLRYLQPRQIAGQLRHRLARVLERPGSFRAGPTPPGVRWRPERFRPAGAQRFRGEALRQGAFAFLNREERLGFPPRWENPGLPRLWQYNLHYFEYLWALSWPDSSRLARDWIARHPLGRGRVGWEPYPTSLRISNWCSYFYGEHRESTQGDAELESGLRGSLALQADWLVGHLEHHLLGNHLLENAAALALCGACFEGPRADAWLDIGRDLLARQLPEQILGDGGHFERSPMYQARVVLVLEALARSGHAGLARLVEDPLRRAREALGRLRHPDGEIALLNDSALGIANPAVELCGEVAPGGVFALADTGYFGARSADGHYVVCDAAPIGPDYLPGHAHGDIFSFELSLSGRRVLVDAGVHGYEADELRRLCRSTRAHNTVEIEGEDQCEFWAAFRVARRGRPRDVQFEPRGDGFLLSAWHDGYTRLDGRPRHRRRFRWHPEGVLLVADRIEAERPVEARSRLHLHPDCKVVDLEPRLARLRHPGGEFAVAFAGEGELSLESSVYCPEFGRRLEARALLFSARGAGISSGFCVANGSGAFGYDLVAGASMAGRAFPW